VSQRNAVAFGNLPAGEELTSCGVVRARRHAAATQGTTWTGEHFREDRRPSVLSNAGRAPFGPGRRTGPG
jgi:hypothetical protein